jgi:hypothetical protein
VGARETAGGVAILAVGRCPTTVSTAPRASTTGESGVSVEPTDEGVEEIVEITEVRTRIERAKARRPGAKLLT